MANDPGAVESDCCRHLHIRKEADVAIARRYLREIARHAGLALTATEALATAVSEIARNIVVHADRGEMVFQVVEDTGRRGVVVVASDHGPGIRDADAAMIDGYSTGGGLGLGLSSAQRLVDVFQLESSPGPGTTVVLKKWAILR
jgi:serine/threonine-protein kinase RsbT